MTKANSEYSFSKLPQLNTLATNSLYKTLLDMSNGKQLLEPKEAAKMLGIDYKVVYMAVSDGRLPAYRFNTQWFIQTADLAAYMEKRSNLPGRESPLETVLESLDPMNPEDYKFRQEIDGYLSERVAQVSKQHSLTKPYALAYVVAEVSALLEGATRPTGKGGTK